MAGSVAVTCVEVGTNPVYAVTWAWTADAITGAVPATLAAPMVLNSYLNGCVATQVEIIPGSPAPTANYAVTLKDAQGVDVAGGQLVNLSATAPTYFVINGPPINSALTLNLTGNTAAGASGQVILWIAPTYYVQQQGMPLTAAQIAGAQTPWLQNINGGNFQLANVGKLGIGTASPIQLLDVGNPAAANVWECISSQSLERLRLGYMYSPVLPTNNIVAAQILADSGGNLLLSTRTNIASNIQFYTCSTTTAVEQMRITSAGYVGIGTTSPNAPLSFGPVSYTPPLGTAYNQFQIILYDGGAPGQTYGIGVEGNNVGFNSNGGYKFYQKAGVSPIMVIGSQTTLNVGIGMASPTHQLHLSTDDAAKLTTNTWTIASGAAVKQKVKPLKGGLDVINKLNPVEAEYNGKGGTPKGQRVVSFIAEEIREILPHTVTEDSEGNLGLNVHEIIHQLVLAVQQLSSEVKKLKLA